MYSTLQDTSHVHCSKRLFLSYLLIKKEGTQLYKSCTCFTPNFELPGTEPFYLLSESFYKVIMAKVRLRLEVKTIYMSKRKTLFMA